FYLSRIKNLMVSDFFTTTRLDLKGNRGSWLQLWDKGTLRTMVIIDKPKFESGELLQLWSQNTRTREWQLVGSIDKIDADSIYSVCYTQMVARSRGLQIKLLSKAEDGQIKEELLAETRIN